MARKHSDETIQRGMTLAASLGFKGASEKTGIDTSTIRYWAKARPEEWSKLRSEAQDKWKAHAAAEVEESFQRGNALQAKAYEKLEVALERENNPKQLAQIIKDIGVAKNIDGERASKLRGGEAVEVNHNIHLPEAVDAYLRQLGVVPAIEGTAQEDERPALGGPNEGEVESAS